jgi:hypothetical protein
MIHHKSFVLNYAITLTFNPWPWGKIINLRLAWDSSKSTKFDSPIPNCLVIILPSQLMLWHLQWISGNILPCHYWWCDLYNGSQAISGLVITDAVTFTMDLGRYLALTLLMLWPSEGFDIWSRNSSQLLSWLWSNVPKVLDPNQWFSL